MAGRFSKACSRRFLPLHARPHFLEPRRLLPLPSLVGLPFWCSFLLGLAWRYLICCWRLTQNGCVTCRSPAAGCCDLSNAWVFFSRLPQCCVYYCWLPAHMDLSPNRAGWFGSNSARQIWTMRWHPADRCSSTLLRIGVSLAKRTSASPLIP